MREKWETTLICDQCGKEFNCIHKQRLKNKHHFCSRKCMSEYVYNHHTSNKYKCCVCGKQITRKPYQVSKSKTGLFCCSLECEGLLRQQIYLGENNPNFGNRGENNPIWRSDERISSYGYKLIRVKNHPYANCDGFVFEHRLVAEKYLLNDENSIIIDGKRYLKKNYDVHHIDHNKLNNDVSNLVVVTRKEHAHIHARERKELAS